MRLGANMVDRHGTDDIPIRVSHLEGSVDRLHSDNQRTQQTLAGVVAQLDTQGRILQDIAEKLDHIAFALCAHEQEHDCGD